LDATIYSIHTSMYTPENLLYQPLLLILSLELVMSTIAYHTLARYLVKYEQPDTHKIL
jgi:hypothetical protein